MPTPNQENRQIVLRERPKGAVTSACFETKTSPVPAISDGQVLVKTLFLSIDPTIRGWMERDTYLPAIELGAVVRSAGAGVVVESKNPKYAPGDRVFALLGWQEYVVLGDENRPTPIPPGIPLEDALSVFGVTGMTAYFGLFDVGRPVPGETVVVSGAAGATGSIVGQLAKHHGCRVVGIAGSKAKCDWLTGELGFDAAIDYKKEDVPARLRETCPKGVNVFFDNVGGPILNHVLARLALRGRVVLCGAISQYDHLDSAYGPPNYINLLSTRGRMEGFIILDYMDRFMEGAMKIGALLAEGKLKHKTTVVPGLDRAPEALLRLFSGDHDGKLLVRVAEE
ncbi:MAG TPA: NADP-dependent oxidoreductase [Polyangiaceae bacterium]|nr:NADP-dependent oxidoreductase [Polyangiaceae bacterium]